MPAPTFNESSLAVGQSWLDESNAALASRGFADGVQACITDATNMVGDYTAQFALPDARWLRLMRPIAIYNVQARLEVIPDAVKLAYESALKELEAIRDGKFTDLLPATEDPVVTVQTGSWGSEPRINIRIA